MEQNEQTLKNKSNRVGAMGTIFIILIAPILIGCIWGDGYFWGKVLLTDAIGIVLCIVVTEFYEWKISRIKRYKKDDSVEDGSY